MNINRLLLTILALIISSTLSPQTVNTDSAKMTLTEVHNDLPLLSTDYYADINSMNRTYDYDLQNKKRMLKMRATEVEVLGGVTAITLYGLLLYFSTTNEWNEWIAIPCGVAVCMTAPYPFFKWAKRLRQKAEAIDVSTAYVLPMNEHVSMGISHFRNKNEQAYNGIGIGIKTTF